MWAESEFGTSIAHLNCRSTRIQSRFQNHLSTLALSSHSKRRDFRSLIGLNLDPSPVVAVVVFWQRLLSPSGALSTSCARLLLYRTSFSFGPSPICRLELHLNQFFCSKLGVFPWTSEGSHQIDCWDFEANHRTFAFFFELFVQDDQSPR